MQQLTLLSRSYCHLCDDMLAALELFQRRFAFTVDVIDIDQHPEFETRYGEWVPVLLCGGIEQGQEICHYFLDEEKLVAVLGAKIKTRRPQRPRRKNLKA